jgi:cell wall assembly regulator SMI1
VIAIRSLENFFEPEPIEVEQMYSIHPGDDEWAGLARNLVAYREYEYVVVGDPEETAYKNPVEFIPIATDGCGNEYCIGVLGSVYGKIYIYSKDGGIDGLKAHRKFDGFYYLARNFPSFLRKLKSEDKF